jgi:uroporphyrinogen-III synthase
MLKVWITRTRPAADDSAKVWRAAGFDPMVSPLLDIQSVSHSPFPKETVLIFTSKNGIDHAVCDGQRAICVGDATADHAQKAGFSDVVSVDGTSADVTKWVRANLKKTQSVTHVSGWHVRGSIIEDLTADGYPATRVKAYRSVPRPIWPETPVSHVALYSPLAARVFADLANGPRLAGLSAICISEATADELSALDLKSVLVAARPREDELIMAAKSD